MFNAITYRHNNPLDLMLVKDQPIALMDGGIADNMGIHSVMIADDERKKEGRFDLILACDVTSYFNNPVEQLAETKNKGLSIQTIINLFKFSIVVFLLCLASIILQFLPVLGYLFVIPSFILAAIYVISAVKLSKLKVSERGTVAKIALKYLGYFLKLPIGVLAPMVRARVNSSVKLISDLFLKQIRRGQYDNLFTKPGLVHRTISCLIYEFSKEHEQRRVSILNSKDTGWWPAVSKILMPSTVLQQTSNEAKSMGTTLWFDENDMSKQKMDKVIATGQFTACYNLIKHICRLEVIDPGYKHDAALQGLKERLFEDWEHFQKDPMFMVNK
jgi:hypothetical protein